MKYSMMCHNIDCHITFYQNSIKELFVDRAAVAQQVESIPGSFCPHVDVSLNKTLNPKHSTAPGPLSPEPVSPDLWPPSACVGLPKASTAAHFP